MTALTNAIVPALVADGLAVGVGRKPDGLAAGAPYVVIWPDGGVRSAVTMRANDGLTETWTCHCYGQTAESAQVALRKLTAAIYGLHRTFVDGRLVQYPEQLTALPLSRDDDLNPPLYDLAVEWRYWTSAT